MYKQLLLYISFISSCGSFLGTCPSSELLMSFAWGALIPMVGSLQCLTNDLSTRYCCATRSQNSTTASLSPHFRGKCYSCQLSNCPFILVGFKESLLQGLKARRCHGIGFSVSHIPNVTHHAIFWHRSANKKLILSSPVGDLTYWGCFFLSRFITVAPLDIGRQLPGTCCLTVLDSSAYNTDLYVCSLWSGF